jgi:hypothetical protein
VLSTCFEAKPVLWSPASMILIVVDGYGTYSMTAHSLETDLLMVHLVINK